MTGERPATSANAAVQEALNRLVAEGREVGVQVAAWLGERQIVLDWRFTKVYEAAPLRIAQLLGREFGVSGLGRLQIGIEVGGHNDHMGGHHHMGTTRMSSSPADGVVDTDCRLHGVRNLYVAGSSVFPTGGAINPTLSIVALAVRLSDHLRQAVRP